MTAATAYRPLTLTRTPQGIAVTVAWLAADGSQVVRDYNILAAGLAVLACGEAVRPARKLKSKREGKLQRSRKAQ